VDRWEMMMEKNMKQESKDLHIPNRVDSLKLAASRADGPCFLAL
jgi:hypothetical protein